MPTASQVPSSPADHDAGQEAAAPLTVPPLVLGCPPDTPLEAAARPGDPAQPSTRGGLGLRIAVATGSGALLVLSFPPYGAWPLAPVSVAALTLACRGQRLPGAFLCGLAAGLALFLPLPHWASNVGVDAWVALATVEALAIGGLGVVLTVVDRLPGWPVWSAAGWVLEEAVRGRAPFGGFPWGRLAFGQGATPFTEYAAWGGAPLVTFAVALCGSLLAWVALDCLPRPAPGTRRVLRRVLRRVGGVVAVLAVPVVGLVAPVALPVSGTATVAVVQGNVPRLGLEFNAQRAAVLGNHVAATERLGDAIQAGREPQPDLVVWPENSSDIDPLVDPDAAAQIDRAARSIWAAASGSTSGSMSEEFSGHTTRSGWGSRPAWIASPRRSVAATWLPSTAARWALNSRPSRGTLPWTTATVAVPLTGSATGATSPTTGTASTATTPPTRRSTRRSTRRVPGAGRGRQSSAAQASRLPQSATAKVTNGAPPQAAYSVNGVAP